MLNPMLNPMLNLSSAAKLIAAEHRGADVFFNAVSTDSRKIAPGDLFVALHGENFDGRDFVTQAIAQGAVAAMVDRNQGSGIRNQASEDRRQRTEDRLNLPADWDDVPLLVVSDTRLALGSLAAQWRKRFAASRTEQTVSTVDDSICLLSSVLCPLIAITGSNGKTTVKEMLAAILRVAAGQDSVLATSGNFNNDIGLPLTLLKLRDGHRYAVIEMGMNHPGEIAYLTDIARPDVALITNAQLAHLAGLGTVEAVARAKGEIFQGLAADGTAVINADDPHVGLWRELAGARRVLTFGLDATVNVTAAYELHPGGCKLSVTTPKGRFDVALQAAGAHNVRNALTATAAATALGVEIEAIAQGLAAFSPVQGRLQAKPGLHGATLIDDTYNANPGSVRAAIDALAAYLGSTVIVLGDMGELGADAPRLHREIGAYAKQAGITRLLALGEASRETATGFGLGGRHFEYVEDLLHELENLLAPQVTVLVKGSRFMKMERVVKCLVIGESVMGNE
ncbi:MAG: UDP-N-acetylmuramoyl-tripeptide--D-alanyl-D-alanine ligase [Sulfuricellaceae bacterium]